MISAGDRGNVFLRKLLGPAVDQMPQVAGIDKKDFIGAVAKLAVGLVAAQKPQAGRNLSVQKQLGGQVDDAVHQPGLDQFFADVPLAGGLGSQRALGQNKTGLTAGA